MLRKKLRKDERGNRSNLYTVIYEPPIVVFPHKGTPVARGGNRVLPQGEAGGVAADGNRTEQFRTQQGTILPLGARARARRKDFFSLAEFQPNTEIVSWAAEHVPEVNPLDPEIIAAFKDHYASNGKVTNDPDAAYRQWIRKEPAFSRRRVQQPFAWSLTWIGARAIRAFLNELLKPAKFSEDQVYRLIEKKRLSAGKFGTQLIASPAAIRERLATLANGGDADGAHGDGRAGEMTDRE